MSFVGIDWSTDQIAVPTVTWVDGRDLAPLHLPNGDTHWVDIDPRPHVGYARQEDA